MNREELLKNPGYLLKKLQYELFDAVHEYMDKHELNQSKFADKLNYPKGYVNQLLNANFDHKLSKIVDLAISIGKVPSINFEDFDAYISRIETERRQTGKDVSAEITESTNDPTINVP